MRDEYGPKPMSKLLRQWLWAGFWLAVTVVLFVLAVKGTAYALWPHSALYRSTHAVHAYVMA